MTTSDLEAMGAAGERFEVIRGVPREVEGIGGRHGVLAAEIHRLVANYGVEHGLGWVFSADTRFVVVRDPEPTLGPDVAFVRATGCPPGRPRVSAVSTGPGGCSRLPE